ncbi:hypothetical protein KB206_02455 [Microvirga sp. STS02]|uniref:hypothetical protein n=1 Tax=Hymenobacter negativus TaxID=2795026 RepID=UPI0018DCD023|nr:MULTISPECIES: hypothetical protein [Bacteria]MBH8567728.1 hypothetical protein [Hymenobacter negativus]MBR7207462.1 hypothetical protein [Microvirga sp. STS02]
MKRIILLASALAAVWVLGGCSPLEDPALVAPEEILLLSVTGKKQLVANGQDKTVLLARVPKEAGQVIITFTTSAGSFPFNNTKIIKQFADSIQGDYRYARTLLRSDTTKGTVYLTAETPQASRRQTVLFIP